MKAVTDSRGIITEERHWATVYAGSREALIAAGLAKAEQFPGEPGCGKTSTVFRPKDGCRKFKVSRRSTYWWEVAIYKTPEETAAYNAEIRSQMEAQQGELESRRPRGLSDHFRGRLAEPGGVRQIADDMFKGAIVAMLHAFNATNNPEFPFAFDKGTIDEVSARLRELRTLHVDGLRPKLGALVQGNPDFQRFMAAAAGAPPKHGDLRGT